MIALKKVAILVTVMFSASHVFAFCQESASDSPADIFAAWNRAKREYLTKIEASQKGVLAQLQGLEEAARNEGELDKVKEVIAFRRAFEEQGELEESLDRKAYDAIREEAKSVLGKSTKDALSKLLKLRQDSIAEIIKNEHEDLLVPIVADAQARWASAEDTFIRESEDAKTLITVQLDKAEAKAREKGDLATVESIKRLRDRFLSAGDVPEIVSSNGFNNQLEKAKRKLEETNKSIVRLLLVNNKDDQAASIQKKLAETFDPSLREKIPINPVDSDKEPGMVDASNEGDSRRAWKNNSYKTTIKWLGKDRWEEYDDGTGQLRWHYKELKRNAEYIEILLIERNHLMRLYPKKAELFQEREWIWVSDGEWLK